MDDQECANCAKPFESSGRGYLRHKTTTSLKRSSLTPEDVMSQSFGITLSPKRVHYVCTECNKPLEALATSSDRAKVAYDEFVERSEDEGQVKRKLDFSSPSKSKRRCSTISTPAKRTQHVIKIPQKAQVSSFHIITYAYNY